MLALLSRHATAGWPALKRSNLDSKVLRRLVGLEAFVDFETSDFVARGALLRAAGDMLTDTRRRFVLLVREALLATGAGGEGVGGGDGDLQKRVKWLQGERECAWRALALAARGLVGWGGVLARERRALVAGREPGSALMMLHAVRILVVLTARHTCHSRCLRSLCPGELSLRPD